VVELRPAKSIQFDSFRLPTQFSFSFPGMGRKFSKAISRIGKEGERIAKQKF
jgi:hypothetical protein